MVGADTRIDGIEYVLTYGQGWLLTHYLTFSHSRRGQFDRYVSQIQQGIAPIDAARAAFGDLTKLNKELYGYVRQKKLPHLILSSSQLQTGAIKIRPLGAAEESMMGVMIRSKRGATSKTARKIAEDARKKAARYPDNAFVQTALAEAELDAGSFEAAEAAADRALAAEPNRLEAMVVKGRAQMERARRSPGNADWAQIRKLFVKANKIDPEAAEPLLLFYQTYLYAGMQPTANAMDGLLYSLALAPQDEKLRMTVVRQLLLDHRVQDARRYFSPFAFEPHFNRKRREASEKTMAALSSGNQPEALAQLGKLEELLLSDR
jgi:tetratricopeptide (TPR) repeat protein